MPIVYRTCPRCRGQVPAPMLERHQLRCLSPRTLERLFEIGNVDTSAEGCWLWRDLVMRSGYGRHREASAHRLALELSGRPPVPGLEASHTCDVKPCVRPDHLFWGTHKQNIQDQHDRGLQTYDAERRAAISARMREVWASMSTEDREQHRERVRAAALEREARRRDTR